MLLVQRSGNISRFPSALLVAHHAIWQILECLFEQYTGIDELETSPGRTIDHFRDLPTDCQTTDITHFAVVFNYYVTIEALEILRRTDKCLWRHNENSKNCGPPPGNTFDLEIGQRSRSPHGTNRKGLSQWSCMPNINAVSLILRRYEPG